MARNFYDESDSLVLDGLEAVFLSNPGLSLDRTKKTIWLTERKSERVALLSGGGAGHEPAHAGYVGDGMLTAAVSGSVFASPSVTQILSGIGRIATPAGVVLIIKNYTGDVFHFHLAAEKAKAILGIPVQVLVVGDDVSVGRKKSGKVGRRGLAGTILVHKILGAYSREPNATISTVLKLGKLVSENLVTVGASLDHVQIPGRDVVNRSVESQVELGMGIHNEPGYVMIRPRPDLKSLLGRMLNQLLSKDDEDRAYVDFSGTDDVVLLVNNLGGVSPLEFGGITVNVIKELASRGIKPKRVIAGTYMTSFNGLGFSITLLKATEPMLQYIDADTSVPAWNGSFDMSAVDVLSLEKAVEVPSGLESIKQSASSSITMDQEIFKNSVLEACRRVIDAEQRITECDSLVGDGDCGITLARGAKAVSEYIESLGTSDDAVKEVMALTDVLESSMDGTSGAIYGIFFAGLASELRKAEAGFLTSRAWTLAAVGALNVLQDATPAREGDRTLMDALIPFVQALGANKSFSQAVAAARAGVKATKGMRASLGRSVYVEESAWSLVPDPGAEGVLCILEGLGNVLAPAIQT